MSPEAFPTLAAQLARTKPGRTRRPGPLLFVVEVRTADEADPRVLAELAGAAPSSLVGLTHDDTVRIAPVDADPESGAGWAVRGARTLDDLRGLLDLLPGADLVHVVPPHEVTAETLERLARVFELDSVCAAVCDDDRRSDERGIPAAVEERIPPPVGDTLEWGLVLVRRETLDLVLENALATHDEALAADGTFRGLLERLLAAPGLVHRRSPSKPRGASTEPAARSRARSTPSTLRVAIDARCLEWPVSGTHVQVMNLLRALAQTGEVDVTALAPERIHPEARSLVASLRGGVRFTDRVSSGVDVFHRGQQLPSRLALVECMAYGRRFVLTHQDMILDRTPGYFRGQDAWEEFRRASRAALGSADHVGFFSMHAALDAASDGTLDPDRATVVPLGVDHLEADGEAELPAKVTAIGDRPFLLMLGTALAHKNRVFALRVLRELLVEHSWGGSLVLAGGDFPWGSSTPDERSVLAEEPELRGRVVDLGYISDAAKRALYREAALVLFPSLYEGFGLVPFEAAAFETPCLYAWRGPLREFLPSAGAMPEDYSAESTASRILEILASSELESELVSAIGAAGASLTWERTARGYLEVYQRAVAQRPRPLDRTLLDTMPLTGGERQMLDIYRQRPSFARTMDWVVRTGTAVTTSRLGRILVAPRKTQDG